MRWGGRQRPSRRAGGLADGRSWALVTEQWGTIESFLKWAYDIIRFAILERLFDTFVEKGLKGRIGAVERPIQRLAQ